jgi:hypothetical protein
MNKELMRIMGFEKEVEKVEHGFCPFCSQPITMEEFTDEVSKREYKISGLCQKCQNIMFDNEA